MLAPRCSHASHTMVPPRMCGALASFYLFSSQAPIPFRITCTYHAWCSLCSVTVASPHDDFWPTHRPSSLFKKIQQASAAVKFPSYISESAQQLICRMLERDPGARPTAADLLQEPWLRYTTRLAAPPPPPVRRASAPSTLLRDSKAALGALQVHSIALGVQDVAAAKQAGVSPALGRRGVVSPTVDLAEMCRVGSGGDQVVPSVCDESKDDRARAGKRGAPPVVRPPARLRRAVSTSDVAAAKRTLSV
jgi:hypothetical protein